LEFKPLFKDKLPEGRDSLQEVYFEWWLNELIKHGFLKRFERSKRYNLIDSVFTPKLNFKPTKKEPQRYLLVERQFLDSWTYEPDYDLYWEEKSLNFWFTDLEFLYPKDFKTIFEAKWINGEWLSIIDIKPQFFRGGSMSSSVKFPLIQKMMFSKHNIYVQKISPLGKKGLFDNTFTPERYLLQDKRMINRKISQWTPGSIKSYLKENGSGF
jgi:hypothetical protein